MTTVKNTVPTGAEVRAAAERLFGPIEWDAVAPVEPYNGPLPDLDYDLEVIR